MPIFKYLKITEIKKNKKYKKNLEAKKWLGKKRTTYI